MPVTSRGGRLRNGIYMKHGPKKLLNDMILVFRTSLSQLLDAGLGVSVRVLLRGLVSLGMLENVNVNADCSRSSVHQRKAYLGLECFELLVFGSPVGIDLGLGLVTGFPDPPRSY